MTPEQLLQPRHKVLLDYPKSEWAVGAIITNAHWPRKYPGIFKELQWWEDRPPQDMPQYVRDVQEGKVYRVRQYNTDTEGQPYFIEHGGDALGWYLYAGDFMPATKEEYDEYKQRAAP